MPAGPDRTTRLVLPQAAGLLVHALSFWAGAWLFGAVGPGLRMSTGAGAWVVVYLAGVACLLAGVRYPGLRLGRPAALQLMGYAALLALVFWGATMALDLLGNSVRTGRLPAELRAVLPLHLFLVPGVASVGLAAAVAADPSKTPSP